MLLTHYVWRVTSFFYLQKPDYKLTKNKNKNKFYLIIIE